MSRRPGRIKEIVEVTLPKPRWEKEIRSDPRFAELREHIWNLLRGEAEHTEELVAAHP
jgi:NitT/TauT family transport system ATP-binding protein